MLTPRTYLERASQWQGDAPALVEVDGDRTYTYAELDREANRVANALRSRGVRKGDRVAMVLYNTVEFPIALYGIYKSGAVPVPLNYMLATEDFAYVFGDVNPAVVVYDRDVGGPVRGALDDVTFDAGSICVGDDPEVGESFSTVREDGSPDPPPEIPTTAGDMAYVLYTSGTTGAPKGVTFGVETARNRIHEAVIRLGLSQASTALQVSPWFHAGGIGLTVHPVVATGGTLLAATDWDPEPVADAIESEGVTHVVGVPTVAKRIADMDGVADRDFTTVACWVCMGSPLSDHLAEHLMESLTPNLYNGYGTTETLLDTMLRPEDLPAHAGTVGRPSPDKQVRVVVSERGETVRPDRTVPTGEEGEVIVRGPPVMDYYYGKQQATDEAIRDGWYYTGDLGVTDEDGYLTIIGRADDMILSGGELVSPIEVEETLEEHEAVAEAVVVGGPDEEWGEAVTAYVVTDTTVTDDDLDAFCKAHEGLADYKRPRRYEFVDGIERTATGKKQRYRYRNR